MPSFNTWYESVKSDPRLVVFSVNVNEPGTKNARISRVKKMLTEMKYTVPVVYCEDCWKKFGLGGIPTVIIIDKEGKVQFKEYGQPMTNEVKVELQKRLDLLYRGNK